MIPNDTYCFLPRLHLLTSCILDDLGVVLLILFLKVLIVVLLLLNTRAKSFIGSLLGSRSL